MAYQFQWLTFSAARQQLAARLSDSSKVHWTDQELKFYVWQALREFNALSYFWRADFTYNTGSVWNSLALLPGSPRQRTITDTYCYQIMQAMLFEPMTGGTWTGTNQFSITDLSTALQARRDEMIKVTNCNQSLLTGINYAPNTIRYPFPDTVIDCARVRWLPVVSGNPVTLYRDDTIAQEFYEAPLYELPSGTPNTFSLSSEPPLAFQVDIAPSQPGTFEAVVLNSGTPFNPPASTLIGIPDDYAWVLIWGAMADLLGRESEATDRERSAYCLRRYQDGLNLMLKTPWIELGKVQGAAVSVDSIYAADRYSPEWDSSPMTFGPFIVAGGIDFLAAPTNAGIGVTCLGNAPVPVNDGDFLQISRDNWQTVLDLSQVFADFKEGGNDFQQALGVESRAIQACSAENSRLRSMGCFSDILVQRGQVQDRDMERYADASSKGPTKGA